jgi:hypothetical protein
VSLHQTIVVVGAAGEETTVGSVAQAMAFAAQPVKKKCRKPLVLKHGKCRKPSATPAVPAPVNVATPDPAVPATPPATDPATVPATVPAPPVPDTSTLAPGAYAFLAKDPDGQPTHWDKCRTVRYRINPAHVTQPMLDDMFAAIARVSAASGVTFQYVGTTAVVPYSSEQWYAGLYSPTQDTDLYIAFANDTEAPVLAGNMVGLGGPVWRDDGPGGREPITVIGGAVFDINPDLPGGFGGGATRGGLIVHELGHVMNLAHVGDISQVMFPSLSQDSANTYQGGDTAGMQALAAYPCA